MEAPKFPETRVPSLYSEFSDMKLINPDGYQANIHQWQQYILSQKVLALKTNALLEATMHPIYGQPKSLNIVLDSLVSKDKLQPLNSGFFSWLLGYKSNCYVASETYFVKDKLNEKVDLYVNSSKEVVYTKELFYEQVLNIVNKDEQDLFAQELVKRGLVSIRNDTVKTSKGAITETDEAVSQLNFSIYKSNKQLDKLGERVCTYQKLLRSETNKTLLKHYLRMIKVLDKQLEKVSSLVQQLETMVDSVTTSEMNVQTMNVLSRATAAVKYNNDQMGSVDDIEALMDEFQEETERAKELEDKLVEIGVNVDDDEIESELAELEAEQKEKAEQDSEAKDKDHQHLSEQPAQDNVKQSTDTMKQSVIDKLEKLNINIDEEDSSAKEKPELLLA